MMANVAWKPMNTMSGRPGALVPMLVVSPLRPKLVKGSPTKPPSASGPKAMP